jgi:hypothetical protein
LRRPASIDLDEDALRRQRKIAEFDAHSLERVIDGQRDRCGRPDRAALPDAFGTE